MFIFFELLRMLAVSSSSSSCNKNSPDDTDVCKKFFFFLHDWPNYKKEKEKRKKVEPNIFYFSFLSCTCSSFVQFDNRSNQVFLYASLINTDVSYLQVFFFFFFVMVTSRISLILYGKKWQQG